MCCTLHATTVGMLQHQYWENGTWKHHLSSIARNLALQRGKGWGTWLQIKWTGMLWPIGLKVMIPSSGSPGGIIVDEKARNASRELLTRVAGRTSRFDGHVQPEQ